MERLRRLIPITLTPIRATTLGWGWHGARQDLRWVPGPVAPGAIATGMAGAISTLTTRTISIRITSTTSIEAAIELTSETEQAAATNGSTIRNIGEMHPMVIVERQANLADAVLVKPAIVRVKVQVIGLVAAVPELARAVAEQELPVEELETVPVAARVLVIGLVAVELEPDRVAVELQLAPAVEVLQDRARRHDLAEVAAPTKWAIVAFPPERVRAAEG